MLVYPNPGLHFLYESLRYTEARAVTLDPPSLLCDAVRDDVASRFSQGFYEALHCWAVREPLARGDSAAALRATTQPRPTAWLVGGGNLETRARNAPANALRRAAADDDIAFDGDAVIFGDESERV